MPHWSISAHNFASRQKHSNLIKACTYQCGPCGIAEMFTDNDCKCQMYGFLTAFGVNGWI